ncbi:hypothetical protein P1P91_13345 [Halomonas piscis]|uniref:Uncharacterized protein n=2 Tax=Halomonas piscis TaxID=3031727 RepID=A0ABY9YY46_9GAMM|nr:hypothetical protein [Halomonas piscis]WNK19799.1 hypothetical protein P1P91_13345 [Halomonas piscis]
MAFLKASRFYTNAHSAQAKPLPQYATSLFDTSTSGAIMLRTVLLTLFFAAALTLVGLSQAQANLSPHAMQQAESMQPIPGAVQ